MLRMTIHSAVASLVGLIGVARVPLVAQTNLTATATAPTKVALSWTGASGANGYSILRGVGTGTLTSINPAKVTGTTYTDLTAPAGTALRYRIRASYPSGPHTYSDKVSVTTPTAASVASAPAASPAPPSGGAAPAAAAAPPSAPAATGRQLLAQGTPLPVLQAAPLAAASTARMAPVTAPSGPAPQNVRVQSSGPVAHTVVWDRLPGVSGYLVAYSGPTAAGQFLTLTPQPVLAETYQHATIVSPGATFRVTALYADGRQGNTDFVYTNPPPAQAPSGFTAQKTGPGQVALSWQSVPFAKTYRVFGTGMPQDGLVVSTTGTTFSNLADGSYSWQVTADYGGAYLTAGLPTQSITLATAASARYRVVANGFSVIHESYDDMLSRDGKYDEVYGGFTMLHFDRKTGDVLDRDLRRTKVLGDIANFPDRLRAGSASAMGGLKAGDSYPDAAHARYRGQDGAEPNSQTFPFKVWEGTLTDGADAAIILPTMWEQDNDGSPYDAWHQSEVSSASQIWFDGAVQQALKQTSLGVIAPPGSITPNMTPTFGSQSLVTAGFFAALGQPWVAALIAGSRDRPIGMTSGGVPALPRRAIVLTREIIEHALNGARVLPNPAALPATDMWMLAYLDVPVGVIPVLLKDGPGQILQANYVLYLQVERM